MPRKLIAIFGIAASLILATTLPSGCGSKSKDTIKQATTTSTGTITSTFTGSGTKTSTYTGTNTWTNTGTTGTGTGTTNTGTGTTGTGTGTTNTGTGTTSTGTGTSGTSTGPVGTIIPCSQGNYASGYRDMVGGVNHDGEVRMKYYRDYSGADHYDEWGWIKFDLSGIPTSARIKKARMFYYTIDYGFDYEDPIYWGWALYMLTQDPQATPWTDLSCVPNPTYPAQDLMWYGRTAGYGWYPDDELHNNLTPFVTYMNDAISKGQGWVAFKIEGC